MRRLPRVLLTLLLCGTLLAFLQSNADARPGLEPGQRLGVLWQESHDLAQQLGRGLNALRHHFQVLDAEVEALGTEVSDLHTGLADVGQAVCGDLESCAELFDCPCFDAQDLQSAEVCAVNALWSDALVQRIEVFTVFPDRTVAGGFLEPDGGERSCVGPEGSLFGLSLRRARACQRLIVNALGPCAPRFLNLD